MTETEKAELLNRIKENDKAITKTLKKLTKTFRDLHKLATEQSILFSSLQETEHKGYSYTLSNELRIPCQKVINKHKDYIYTAKQTNIDCEILKRFQIITPKNQKQ